MRESRFMLFDIVCRRPFIVGLFALFLNGCVTGPVRENDSALDYLNGRNYRAGSPQGVSPLIRREEPFWTVSGVVQINADPLPLSLAHQTVVLIQGNKEIARTMTDANGGFVLSGEIRNGSYLVILESKKYALSQTVEVSRYKTEGIRLIATAK